MAKVLVLQFVFCVLAVVSLIVADCPPLTKAWNDLETNNLDYFVIDSQTDADKLKTCNILQGELIIYGRNATAPLVIDGPREVEAMTIWPLSNTDNLLLTSITFKTLAKVSDRLEIRMEWPAWTDPTPAQPHISLLDFPALQNVRWLYVNSLAPSVQTFNTPLLEHVSMFWFFGGDNVHTINAPKLSSVQTIRLTQLPSMTTPPTFFSSLKGLVQDIEIWNMTGLTSVDFPNIEVLSSLHFWGNPNLEKASFQSLKLVTELSGRAGGSIKIKDNNPEFHLSLPKLKGITGSLSISGLSGIDIPELESIGETVVEASYLGGLYVGAIHDEFYYRAPICTNCRPLYLTSFSAPKLRNVVGRIAFDSAPELSNINFPSLKRAGDIRMNNTLALEMENGLEMPEFRQVGNLQIVGKEAKCEGWDNLFCKGRVGLNYSCGREDVVSRSEEAKRWPSFPPSCGGKQVLPVKDTFDGKDWMDWMSKKVWGDCYAEMFFYCVRGYTLRTGFLVTVGLFVFSIVVLWCVFKSRFRIWLRQRDLPPVKSSD